MACANMGTIRVLQGVNVSVVCTEPSVPRSILTSNFSNLGLPWVKQNNFGTELPYAWL